MADAAQSGEAPRLRPLTMRDLGDIRELVRDAAVRAFLGAGRSSTDLENGLKREIDRFEENGWGLFAIVSENKEFLGYVGFVPGNVDECEGPELVCAVRQEFRGIGVGTDACQQAIDWGFATHHWPCISACVAQANAWVKGLALRLGMRFLKERPSFIDGAQLVYCLSESDLVR